MLDRDDLAARFAVAIIRAGSTLAAEAVTREAWDLAATFEAESKFRAALVPVAPASGAPLAAPSRPECRPYVYSHLKVDGAPPVAWAIRSGTGEYDTFRWTAAEAHEEVARLNSDEYGHDVQKIVKRRPFSAVPLYATSSERAAAGLPVDETPAFDEASEREAFCGWLNGWGEASKWGVAGFDNVMDQFMWRAWLARARVAANGGAS